MDVRHVQAELNPAEYKAFREASLEEGRSVKEAVREAILQWVRERRGDQDSIFQLVGIAKGTPTASANHDEIYDED